MRRAMARAWRPLTTGLGVDGVQRDSLPIKMSCNQCEVYTSADYLLRAGGYARWSSTDDLHCRFSTPKSGMARCMRAAPDRIALRLWYGHKSYLKLQIGCSNDLDDVDALKMGSPRLAQGYNAYTRNSVSCTKSIRPRRLPRPRTSYVTTHASWVVMIDISAAYLIREEIAAKSEYTFRLNIGRIVEFSRSRLEDSKSSTHTSWAFYRLAPYGRVARHRARGALGAVGGTCAAPIHVPYHCCSATMTTPLKLGENSGVTTVPPQAGRYCSYLIYQPTYMCYLWPGEHYLSYTLGRYTTGRLR